MRGATGFASVPSCGEGISIHAPRAGSDPHRTKQNKLDNYFNPRSPCGERLLLDYIIGKAYRFQSTLPVRGATGCTVKRDCSLVISIHAPRAGSDCHWFSSRRSIDNFNPRSPCGERQSRSRKNWETNLFQSTLPVRGATRRLLRVFGFKTISIHAPRAGSDHTVGLAGLCILISIHAPRAGSDMSADDLLQPAPDFNPRSPCGERRGRGSVPRL